MLMTISNTNTNALLIVQNLLYGKKDDLKTFDLKGTFGSKRLVGEDDDEINNSAKAADSGKTGDEDDDLAEASRKRNTVLLDNNFMNYTAGFPIPLQPKVNNDAFAATILLSLS